MCYINAISPPYCSRNFYEFDSTIEPYRFKHCNLEREGTGDCTISNVTSMFEQHTSVTSPTEVTSDTRSKQCSPKLPEEMTKAMLNGFNQLCDREKDDLEAEPLAPSLQFLSTDAWHRQFKPSKFRNYKNLLSQNGLDSFMEEMPPSSNEDLNVMRALPKSLKRQRNKHSAHFKATRKWSNPLVRAVLLIHHEECYIYGGSICGSEKYPVSASIVHRISARRAFCRSLDKVCAGNRLANSTLRRKERTFKHACKFWKWRRKIKFPFLSSLSDSQSSQLTMVSYKKKCPRAYFAIQNNSKSEDIMTLPTIADFPDSHIYESPNCTVAEENFSKPQSSRLFPDVDYATKNLLVENHKMELQSSFKQNPSLVIFECPEHFYGGEQSPVTSYDVSTNNTKQTISTNNHKEVCINGIEEWSFLSNDSGSQKEVVIPGIEEWSFLSNDSGGHKEVVIPGIDEWSFLSDSFQEKQYKDVCISGIDEWSMLSEEEAFNEQTNEFQVELPPIGTLFPFSGAEEGYHNQTFNYYRIFPDTRVKFTSHFDPISEEEACEIDFFDKPALGLEPAQTFDDEIFANTPLTESATPTLEVFASNGEKFSPASNNMELSTLVLSDMGPNYQEHQPGLAENKAEAKNTKKRHRKCLKKAVRSCVNFAKALKIKEHISRAFEGLEVKMTFQPFSVNSKFSAFTGQSKVSIDFENMGTEECTIGFGAIFCDAFLA